MSFLRKSILYFGILSLIVLSSCVTHRYGNREAYVNESEIIIKPLSSEIEVDHSKIIIGSSRKLSFVPKLKINETKESAKWNAIEEAHCDILVDPVYRTTVGPLFFVKTEVYGYKGNYTSIQTASSEDLRKQYEYDFYEEIYLDSIATLIEEGAYEFEEEDYEEGEVIQKKRKGLLRGLILYLFWPLILIFKVISN